MPVEAIFALQLVFSLIVLAAIARAFIAPWLATMSLHAALAVLVAPHMFRHIGMSFQVPGLVGDRIPADFASTAAYGDLASAVFALFAFMLLSARARYAIPVVWALNILGSGDLINALRRADAIPELGVTWFIPTFVVPVLLVSHVMIFARLINTIRWPTRSDDVWHPE